ncbi:glycoside hydrolase family 16 protein [Streptomyces sp. NPDC046215]|uniref:GH16 domain-containing protein n=1 Tax=Streptomyces stramineus TaxID=173861 RepID=A0ABP3L3V5_9ACTN
MHLPRLSLAGLLVTALLSPAPEPADAAPRPQWRLRFSDGFDTPAPRGAFSDCDHFPDTGRAYCGGLTGRTRADWWAYPDGWPDTATQRAYPVGGRYDPATTVWISGGRLHLRLWRGPDGDVHSAAVVPKPMMGLRYGRYEERFRVSRTAVGYKSAHLLWPVDEAGCRGCEIDFPEFEWTGTIHAFTHPKGGGRQDAFDTGALWTSWHTSVIEWTPSGVAYFLDGRLIGRSVSGVPDRPMSWILQNEAALDGSRAAPGSRAQLDVDRVRGWSWAGAAQTPRARTADR